MAIRIEDMVYPAAVGAISAGVSLYAANQVKNGKAGSGFGKFSQNLPRIFDYGVGFGAPILSALGVGDVDRYMPDGTKDALLAVATRRLVIEVAGKALGVVGTDSKGVAANPAWYPRAQADQLTPNVHVIG